MASLSNLATKRAVTLILAATLTACASARITRDDANALADADARVLDGCYDCLLRARAVYARLDSTKHSAQVIVRLFETNLLLALREKELALDWHTSVERARSLVPRLPRAFEPTRVIDAVDAVLPDGIGTPIRVLDTLRKTHGSYAKKVPDELTWIATAPMKPAVRDYLSLALECSYPTRPTERIDADSTPRNRRTVAPDAPPLIVYRTGICSPLDTSLVARARKAVPEFVEADYFLAQPATFIAGETGGDDARPLLERAYARFPRSSGVTLLSGWLESEIGECDAAVSFFEQTVDIEPAHEYAWLQQTTCLSNLRRHDDAIESATRLIALESSMTGQGYFWRAVNRLRKKELTEAREDIEVAKRLLPTGDVLTVAGMIEHDQDDLVVAERDLVAARAKPAGARNCTAAWYLARVMMKVERWTEAGETYESAMTCYGERIAGNTLKIAELRADSKIKPAYRAKRIAALEADIAELRRSFHASAFNSASNRTRNGHFARARELLEIAAADSTLADPVARLRAALRGR